jgi:hypothetical protein
MLVGGIKGVLTSEGVLTQIHFTPQLGRKLSLKALVCVVRVATACWLFDNLLPF